MWQWASRFRLSAVRHQPAGDSHSDGHKGQQSRYDQSNDEPDLWDTDLLVIAVKADLRARCASDLRSIVKMALLDTLSSSLRAPVNTVPSTWRLTRSRLVSLSISKSATSSLVISRLRRPKAFLPPQFCGWHWPKQTRTLHWNRMLFWEGNLKAENEAFSTPSCREYSHSSKQKSCKRFASFPS